MSLTAAEIAKIAFTRAIQANGAALFDADIQKAKALWAEIRQEFQGQEAVEDALNDVESQESLEILEQQIVPMLARAMEKDAPLRGSLRDRFAQKLQNIAQEINLNTGIQKKNITTEDIRGENATCDLSRSKTEKFRDEDLEAEKTTAKRDLTPSEILTRYKGQQSCESGFRFLKDPLFFADAVFLKTPSRIEAMAMLMGWNGQVAFIYP